MAHQDTPAAGSGILINEAIAFQAFEAWETACRLNPAGFMSHEDVARMAAADTAHRSAIYFMAMLRFIGARPSVHDTVASQTVQPLAVSAPGSVAAGGNTPIVVEVYALGSGVAVKRESRDLACRQGTLELEAHGKRIVVDPLGASKTNWYGATVQGDVRPVLLSLETVDQEEQAELGLGCTHWNPPLKTAILSLPQGFGKSTVAQDLARWLGCTVIVEEWSPALPVVHGALHLTNVEVAA